MKLEQRVAVYREKMWIGAGTVLVCRFPLSFKGTHSRSRQSPVGGGGESL